MIRYDYTLEQINAAVDAVSPTWRTRADKRTETPVAQGHFAEQSSIWSEVKPVFIEIQKQKCVFCERQFETAEYGRIEYDLEHFRPKSSVEPWPPKGWKVTYQSAMGDPSPTGYFWLAYDLQNYAASCKVCNTPLKSNYFRVAGSRGAAETAVDKLQREKPYLCYPIGTFDDDPEDLVTFIATTAVPAAKTGHKRRRGEVIIDFFQLNQRDQLHHERARMIAILAAALKSIDAGLDVAENAVVVEQCAEPHVPHAGCLRAYRRLWDGDRPLDQRVHSLCRSFALSSVGGPPPVP
jgi:hypothetical protein